MTYDGIRLLHVPWIHEFVYEEIETAPSYEHYEN